MQYFSGVNPASMAKNKRNEENRWYYRENDFLTSKANEKNQ